MVSDTPSITINRLIGTNIAKQETNIPLRVTRTVKYTWSKIIKKCTPLKVVKGALKDGDAVMGLMT